MFHIRKKTAIIPLFAKDGFTYRTAYFEDYDGQYYKITLSVGNDGNTATIYNIGNIKEDQLPSAKLIAVVGSKPLGKKSSIGSISDFSENVNENYSIPTSLEFKKTDMRSPSNRNKAENGSNIPVSNSTVPQNEQSVNTNSMQANKNYSIPVLERAERTTENTEFTEQINELNGKLQQGEISQAEFIERVRNTFNETTAPKRQKVSNPVEIANMTEEDADTTPPLKRKQGESKFTKFRYYETPVKFMEYTAFVSVNVGYGKTDSKYHIYDLTEPKERNTPSRINGFTSPVGNLIRKGVSNNDIPTNSENVNKNF